MHCSPPLLETRSHQVAVVPVVRFELVPSGSVRDGSVWFGSVRFGNTDLLEHCLKPGHFSFQPTDLVLQILLLVSKLLQVSPDMDVDMKNMGID